MLIMLPPFLGVNHPTVWAQMSLRKSQSTNTTDSLHTTLHLPNPFLKQQNRFMAFSTQQMISAWVMMHRNQLYGEVRPAIPSQRVLNPAALPRIDWSLNQPGRSIFGLDYRGSSLYVPENVRDYLDYSMGRERYVPIASLLLASYLAYEIYQRYGYLLWQRERDRYRGVYLDETEIAMMEVLWKQPGLLAPVWYGEFHHQYHLKNVPFLEFKRKIHDLDEKIMLKTRKIENEGIRYFPAISREELIRKLKEEMKQIDFANFPQRWQQIQEMLHNLDELSFPIPEKKKHIELQEVH